ncbi:hypothetical protein PGT21_034294 [Puccinia graminis f. sp. tritici]|uniref:Uncharacterized protein n=1 Tax=Puccinia graminis f. sp. tritici TaxID=56615 RepID=A0A5B0P0D7_PUCGR|nr:hypothetical protein PGT21_034294 [Puccinia graminis f. sp. tritici]
MYPFVVNPSLHLVQLAPFLKFAHISFLSIHSPFFYPIIFSCLSIYLFTSSSLLSPHSIFLILLNYILNHTSKPQHKSIFFIKSVITSISKFFCLFLNSPSTSSNLNCPLFPSENSFLSLFIPVLYGLKISLSPPPLKISKLEP